MWLGAIPNELFTKNDLLDDLKKALRERILNAELDEHLGEEVSRGTTNGRNGGIEEVSTDGNIKD